MSTPLWISSVTIGSPDPRAAARFYHRLLGWEISAEDPPGEGRPPEAGWAQLRAPAGQQGLMTINLEYEAAHTRPIWPSEPGRQHVTTHLDIPVTDLAAAEAAALEAGAVLASDQPQDDVRVLLDPDGHPFCLFRN